MRPEILTKTVEELEDCDMPVATHIYCTTNLCLIHVCEALEELL